MSTSISNNDTISNFNDNVNHNVLESFLKYNPQKDPLFHQDNSLSNSNFKFFNVDCPICFSKIKQIFFFTVATISFARNAFQDG